MKRQLIGLVCALAASTIVAAQSGNQNPAPDDQQKSPEVTLTGCLTQGSGPTVFIFDNAKADPKSVSEKGRTFVVVEATEDLSLARHVNHEVALMGQAEAKMVPPPAPGEKVVEKDLPKFQVKTLKMVSESCTAATR
jgi:hypothetical protein